MLKTDAKRLTEQLMQQHMPDMLADGWKFGWHKSVRTFGRCHYGFKEITLSEQLVQMNDAERVERTVLHEIAHAIAGKKAGHGSKWRAVCIKLGGNGIRCWSDDDTNPVPPKYIGTCPAGHKSRRYRKPRGQQSCGKCCPTFNRDHLIKWAAVV